MLSNLAVDQKPGKQQQKVLPAEWQDSHARQLMAMAGVPDTRLSTSLRESSDTRQTEIEREEAEQRLKSFLEWMASKD